MYLYQENNGGRSIYRFPDKLVGSNMYFVSTGETGVVIDPNVNNELLYVFGKLGTKKVLIALTHEHYDHTMGIEWLRDNIETKLFCQKKCGEAIASVKGNDPNTLAAILSIRDAVDGGNRRDTFMLTAKNYTLHADTVFDGECVLKIGDIILTCISTPGHSPGSACFILDGFCVFTGDSLIKNTPTILKLPGGNKKDYLDITRPFLRSLDENMMVYPGHEVPFKLCEAQYL